MRSLASSLALSAVVLGLAFGCGQSEGDSQTPGGAGSVAAAGSGHAGTPAGHAGSSATAGSSSAGSSATAGSSSGGVSANGGAGGASGGQPPAQAGTGSGGQGANGLVDCDPKKILCKRAAPVCDAGQVPSVEGSCYGDCVKVDRCACSAADQCPDPEQYTCWAKQHCGPYVR